MKLHVKDEQGPALGAEQTGRVHKRRGSESSSRPKEKAKPKRRRKQSKSKKTVQLDSLKQINLNAAGLDVGAAEIWACVPEGRDTESVRMFRTFTPDLHALADWLERCGADTVAMESTGVYWIPIYEILGSPPVKCC
jgi:hypothetical protein